MAVTATRAIWEGSRATGNALLVLLALGDHINGERLKAGHAAEAWPSQTTLAEKCNCSRSTVERSLRKLQELEEIFDTGNRYPDGWQLLFSALDNGGASNGAIDCVRMGHDRADYRSG